MADYSPQLYACGSILVFTTTISLLCTVLNLYLIYDINLWNGHMYLIFILTCFQGLYEISFYFLLGFRSTEVYAIYKFLAVFSGTFISLWINYISMILYYTIFALESYDIKKHYWKVFLIDIGISVFLALLIASYYVVEGGNSDAEMTFYWLRIGSIGFNLILYVLTAIQLYDIYYSTFSLWQYIFHHRIVSKTINKASHDSANGPQGINYFAILRIQTRDLLLVLSSRLKYYPVVQIISLAGSAWWEYRYGFHTTSFDGGSFPIDKELSLYLFTLFCPTAGIGFLIVFLMVQPMAYDRFLRIIKETLLSFGCYDCCLRGIQCCCGINYHSDKESDYDFKKEYTMTDRNHVATQALFEAASRPTSTGKSSTHTATSALSLFESNHSSGSRGSESLFHPTTHNPLIIVPLPEFNFEDYRSRLTNQVVYPARPSVQSETDEQRRLRSASDVSTRTSDARARTRTKSSNRSDSMVRISAMIREEAEEEGYDDEEEKEMEAEKEEEEEVIAEEKFIGEKDIIPEAEEAVKSNNKSSPRSYLKTRSTTGIDITRRTIDSEAFAPRLTVSEVNIELRPSEYNKSRRTTGNTADNREISQFTIEQEDESTSYRKRLETMTEESLWAEFEKRRKDSMMFHRQSTSKNSSGISTRSNSTPGTLEKVNSASSVDSAVSTAFSSSPSSSRWGRWRKKKNSSATSSRASTLSRVASHPEDKV